MQDRYRLTPGYIIMNGNPVFAFSVGVPVARSLNSHW